MPENNRETFMAQILSEVFFTADKNAEIFCWGGDLMEAAGAKLLVHYRKMAFMGFVAVVKNLEQ